MNRKDDNENYGTEDNIIKIVSAESEADSIVTGTATITLRITQSPVINFKGFNIKKLLSFNKAKNRD